MPGRYISDKKNTDAELSMWKKKQRLRGIYKQWKCGLITWDQIDPEDQMLLEKYYHVRDPI